MSQLTIEEIIQLGDISVPLSANYTDNGKLFGGRSTSDSPTPTTIAMVTDALRWQNDSFPNLEALDAIGSIEITTLSTRFGMHITVYVDDPVFGLIILGNYVQQPTDTTTDILAQSIADALALNTYGYTISRQNSTVLITARPGLGTIMNTGNRLMALLSNRIFDNSYNNKFN